MEKRIFVRNCMSLAFFIFTTMACSTQETTPIAIDEPDPDLYFVRGYRSASDPCKLTGETAFTNQFLQRPL